MRKKERKICRKCGTSYIWTSGGIVPSPLDFADRGLCSRCRILEAIKRK